MQQNLKSTLWLEILVVINFFYYFWLTIKCFAKDSSGNIWKHIKILSGGRAGRGPCVWGRWELWGRLQTQTLWEAPDPWETLICHLGSYPFRIFTFSFRNPL